MRRLRIAILAPCWFAVPPSRYGGIEWVVSLLADGLVDAGHDVTLFAAGGSRTRARLVTSYDEPPSLRIGTVVPDLHHAATCYLRAGEFDVINDHSGQLAAALAGSAAPTPVCHTIHGPLDGEPGEVYRQIAALNPRLRFISLSHNQRRGAPDLPWLANCYNALDLGAYPFSAEKGDYLLFLGRLAPEKGALEAIRTALAVGVPIKVAGKMHDVQEREHFAREIEPLLGDGVEYVGEIEHDEKVALLQGARLTLFPISWEEPFGLVMIESMACGTPVLATRRGAVPEVIEQGLGGIVVDDASELAGAVERAAAIDPRVCREAVERRFSPPRMVDDYLAAYERLLSA